MNLAEMSETELRILLIACPLWNNQYTLIVDELKKRAAQRWVKANDSVLNLN